MGTAFKTTLRVCAAVSYILLLAGAGSAQASTGGSSGFDTTLVVDYNGDPGTTLSSFFYKLVFPDREIRFWNLPSDSIAPGGESVVDFGEGPTLIPPELNAPTEGTIAGVMVDANDVAHVVAALDPTVASALVGHSWSELFPFADETVVANALMDLTDPTKCSNLLDCLPQFAAVDGFDNYLSALTDPTNPANTLDGYFSIPGDFSLVSFSDAQIVGSGSSINTPLGGGAVPEPSAWTMLILGFGALGWAARRRTAALA